MWDDFGLGVHAMALQSFMMGRTYLTQDGRVCMGGMDVTNCDWLFEPYSSNNTEKKE